MMVSLQLTTCTRVSLWSSSWLWVGPCSSGLTLSPQPPAPGSPVLHRAQLGVPQGLLANSCSWEEGQWQRGHCQCSPARATLGRACLPTDGASFHLKGKPKGKAEGQEEVEVRGPMGWGGGPLGLLLHTADG